MPRMRLVCWPSSDGVDDDGVVCAVCGASGSSFDSVASSMEDELVDVDEASSKRIVLSVLCASAGRVGSERCACAAPQKRHSDRNILTEHGERDSFVVIGLIV